MLEFIVFVAMGVVIWQLYERLGRVERMFGQRLNQLEWQLHEAREAAAPAEATAPAPTPVSVPRTAAAKTVVEPEPERLTAPLPAPEPEPEPEPEPLPEPATDNYWSAPPPPAPDTPASEPGERAAYARPKFDFEDIFGRRLPIWAGGIALAVAGIFLVKYSIESGLLTPTVRVALSFVFGMALLGVAEAAHRFEKWVADPRVRQALAGAGLATLYAAFYLAGAMYGLIGVPLAFGGLACVTALAIGLTFRFGLPAAVLGLVGGFATPLMVASEGGNVPVLTFYLALLTAGLSLTGRRIGQPWLSIAALAAGFGWGAVLLATELAGDFDHASVGLYLLALGVGVPLLAVGHKAEGPWSIARVGAGAVAALQLAFLINLAGYDALTLGLFLLLAAALAALSWREEALRPGNQLVAALGVLVLAVWPEPEPARFALTAGVFALIALGLPLALLWRGKANIVDLLQLTLGAAALAAVSYAQFGEGFGDVLELPLAAAFAALAAFPMLAAWHLWRGGELARWLPLPVGIAALLAYTAQYMVLAEWAEVIGAVAIALVLAFLMHKRRGHSDQGAGLVPLAWAGAGLALLTLLGGDILPELSRLIGITDSDHDLPHALIRWTAASLPFAALAWLHAPARLARVAEALLAFTVYGLVAQVVPGDWLAWTAAILAGACLLLQRIRAGFWGGLAVFAGLWGVVVLGEWAVPGIEALTGEPMLAGFLPDWRDTLRLLLPSAATLGLAAWVMRGSGKRAAMLAIAAGGLALVIGHLLFKMFLSLETYEQFVALGMAERTMWQALLLAAGVGLARLHPSKIAQHAGTALATLALAHFVWFTLILHNPLWAAQAVGPLPVANWLLPAYALAGIAVVWLATRSGVTLRPRLKLMADGGVMGLIVLLALSTLRHVYSGSVISALPMSQAEDLLRSLVGIVLALAFLWWGSRTGTRSWRIGSLVVMLVAVLKVFLVDAAGLEGLLRIASFLALGFSLIGIGWVYSRQLAGRKEG